MLKKVSYKDIWRFSAHYWRRRTRIGIAVLVLKGAATITDAFVPVYTGKIVDAMTASSGVAEGFASALAYLGVFAALFLGYVVLHSASMALWAWFAANSMYEILNDAMRKVQRFSSDWHANTFAGGTVRKITRGMWAFDTYEDTLLIGIFPAVLIMIGMSAVLAAKLPLVGLFTAVMALLYVAVSAYTAIRIASPLFRASADSDTRVGASLADIITGNPTVKTFGAESREEHSFSLVTADWKRLSLKAWLTSEFIHMSRGMLRLAMMVGMLGITIWMWRSGKATPGDIAFSLTGFFMISGYLRDIGMQIANLQRSTSEMEDIVLFWMRKDEILDHPQAAVFKPGKGEIVFDNVDFIYQNQSRPLFSGLSVEISPGENVALVGHSGSGKSSFVRLIQRLYDVDGGQIRIDGQNIAMLRQESLRRSIALVPQEPILFHRSIAENIAYGRPEANMDEIVEAAKKAYAHDFITSLPDNYGALVGERGIKLSGGERQRIAIARAILSDAPILILDEATSSLDSISEHYIQKALANLMKGRTTITIAHRLSTIRHADRILVFDRGRIVEQGAHAELVRKESSHYRKLYEVQSGSLSAGLDGLLGAAE